MKPAHEDLLHRRPVWEALSDPFLDTDPSLARSWRVGILAASPYSIEELQGILVDEVYPVCRSNLFSVAGEWAGFDPEWLESSILRRLGSPFHRWRRFSLGRFTIHLSLEWRHTKAGVIQQRAQTHARNTAYQNHCTERGRATSVANADATGRPRRSVLALADVSMSATIQVEKQRFEDVGDIDDHGRHDYCYRGYNYAVTVDDCTFHVRSYDETPGEAIVGTARPDVSDRRLRCLVDHLTQGMGFSAVKFYSGRLGHYRAIDLRTLEFTD